MRVSIEDGKYEYVTHEDGRSEVLRYGERWRDCAGDKFTYCMAAEIETLRQQLAEKDAEIARLKQRAIQIRRENVAAIRQELVEIGLLSEERGWIRHGGVQDFLTLEAEIMLLRQSIGGRIDGAGLMKKLAASQSREQQSRDALQDARTADDIGYCASGDYFTEVIDAALALPADTSALEAMIAKAGEVMRERCANEADPFENITNALATHIAQSIRALPGVTLEDLK